MAERVPGAARTVLATAAAALAGHRLMRRLEAERAEQRADEARRERDLERKEARAAERLTGQKAPDAERADPGPARESAAGTEAQLLGWPPGFRRHLYPGQCPVGPGTDAAHPFAQSDV